MSTLGPARKKIRLAGEKYRGRGWYFITICCRERRTPFADPAKAQWIIARLRDSALEGQFRIPAYCVMPDHLHFLAEGMNENCDLIDFVRRFKQKTAYEASARFGLPLLWQRYFYDHILRRAEAIGPVIWYIWLNPVRKGMCVQPADYPYLGSFTGEAPKRQPEFLWQPPWKTTTP